eukprot:3043911-Pleurochrysis_carterae.AAC.2
MNEREGEQGWEKERERREIEIEIESERGARSRSRSREATKRARERERESRKEEGNGGRVGGKEQGGSLGGRKRKVWVWAAACAHREVGVELASQESWLHGCRFEASGDRQASSLPAHLKGEKAKQSKSGLELVYCLYLGYKFCYLVCLMECAVRFGRSVDHA